MCSANGAFSILARHNSDLMVNLTFIDGELGNFRVMIPNQSIKLKTTGGAQKEREKNKLRVTFTSSGKMGILSLSTFATTRFNTTVAGRDS